MQFTNNNKISSILYHKFHIANSYISFCQILVSVETPMVETDKREWFQCGGLLTFYFILRIRYKISLTYNGKSYFFAESDRVFFYY